MDMKIDVNKSIALILDFVVENLVSTRFLLDEISHLTYPDDEEARRIHGLLVRQKVASAKKTILLRIYQEDGSINLKDILGDNPE
jgi:hypothetical protein